MAVCGLGCPVRFVLAASQKGDAPQADSLLAGMSAESVMADSDRLRDTISEIGAVIPNTPSRATQAPARDAFRILLSAPFIKAREDTVCDVTERLEFRELYFRAVVTGQAPKYQVVDAIVRHA